MGAVYQAEHVDLEKRVALKTLLAASARDTKATQRFRRKAASSIGNPFICDVTDFGELPDGQVFYVMEFIEGPSLRQVLEADKSVAAPRAIAILRQTCKALGAAHAKGIIHLDVKPDNIMLARSGRREDMVKVVDFGIAGLISAQPAPDGTAARENVVGTPDYLAPERVRGKGYDHRSDIYSLGAMAYEMLTGTCPFWDEDVMTTITKQVTAQAKPLRQQAPDLAIPEGIDTLVTQMLAKNPAERPQSMAVVEAMLCEADRRTFADRMGQPRAARDRRRMAEEAGQSDALAKIAPLAAGGCGFRAGRGGWHRLRALLRSAPSQGDLHPGLCRITKTDEAETVAPWLGKAGLAAAAERFFEPATDSALYYIEQAEREAQRVGKASGGAELFRRLYGNQFRSLGNALLAAKMTDLAALRFGQALRFLPGDADLRGKLDAVARGPADKDNGSAGPRRPVDDAARLAAELFSDVGASRYSQARVTLARLLEADNDQRQTARLADEFRQRAQALWESGKRRAPPSIKSSPTWIRTTR